MMVLTAESVLADLRRYPLLTPEQLTRVEGSARKSAPGPDKMIRRLVERGWLTQFQADYLHAGRTAELVFGKYVLLAKVGEGGMGVVYQARHLRLGRVDALKVIRADRIASQVVARRFLREIRLTSSLEHPNIVRATDAGRVGRQFYLATEFIAGEDLGTAVRQRGPLPIADACLVVYQASLALQYIHGKGLVHRDLKPSNLVREDATRSVKLLDLGLSGFNAKADPGSLAGTITRDGVMLGTPDFMAPEQIHNPHGVDIRADLYALGCTFFYLLTGRTPFEGSTVEKLTRHLQDPPPPLVLPQGAAPPALAALMSRLLAKQPEDRFPTPQALIDALLALRSAPAATAETVPAEAGVNPAGEPSWPDEWQSEFDQLVSRESHRVHAPAPRPSRNLGPVWRSRWVRVTAALLLVAVGAFTVAVARSGRKPQPPAAESTLEPVAVAEEPGDELKALRKAVANPAESRDQLRRRVLDFRGRHAGTPLAASAAGLLRRLPSPLDTLKPVADPGTDTAVVRLGEPGDPVTWLGFTPADDRLVAFRYGIAAEVWELPAGELSMKADAHTRAAMAGAKLGGRLVGVASNGRSAVLAFDDRDELLARIEPDTERILSRLEQRSEGVQRIEVAADGGSCLVTGTAFGFRLFPLTAGKSVQTWGRAREASALAGAFGSDGQRVYLVGAHRAAARFTVGQAVPDMVYEVGDERPRPGASKLTYSRPGRPTCIAVSADESAVAVGTRMGDIYLYAAASGKPTQELHLAETVRAVAFSTHGRVLAVALDDGSVLLVPLKG
jgi:serine/threonine protein kinase